MQESSKRKAFILNFRAHVTGTCVLSWHWWFPALTNIQNFVKHRSDNLDTCILEQEQIRSPKHPDCMYASLKNQQLIICVWRWPKRIFIELFSFFWSTLHSFLNTESSELVISEHKHNELSSFCRDISIISLQSPYCQYKMAVQRTVL